MSEKLRIMTLCGKRIKEGRLSLIPPLTLEKLAELVSVTHGTVSKWETGAQFPRPDYLEKMAEIFRKPFSYFFTEDEAEILSFADRDKTVEGLISALKAIQNENKFLKQQLQAPIDTGTVRDARIQDLEEENLRLRAQAALEMLMTREQLQLMAEIFRTAPPEFLEGLPRLTDEQYFRMMIVMPEAYPNALGGALAKVKSEA